MINILSNGIRKAAQRATLTEKALDLACDFIDELGADCSVCKSVCKKENCINNTAECWKKYFILKARSMKCTGYTS